MGLRWRGAAEPDVELRVRRHGRWSRWAQLAAHSEHNPDLWRGEGLVASSDPIWVGRASAVQYRLSRRVPGLKLHFVDLRRDPAGSRGARAAQATPPAYVPREDWGANRCPPRSGPEYGTVRAVHVHHTVSLNDYSPEESPAIVLAVCRYHRNSNGWNDIGYNALVDKYGTLFEGRAGGLDQAIVGAQAQGFNSQTAGIANIGDHSNVAADPRGAGHAGQLHPLEADAARAAAVRSCLPGQCRRLGHPLPGRGACEHRAGQRPPRHGPDRLSGSRSLRPAARTARAR